MMSGGRRPIFVRCVTERQRQGRRGPGRWTTDDADVAEVAQAHGAEVPFLRPPELAADLPSLKPVIAHAVHALEAAGDHVDLVVILQATTPFRDASAIDAALDRLTEGPFDTVVSVGRTEAQPALKITIAASHPDNPANCMRRVILILM